MVTKRTILAALWIAGAAALAGCEGERAARDVAGPEVQVAPAAAHDARASERLARRMALALRSPGFRAYLRQQLALSPQRERKLAFASFLGADGARARTALAQASGEREETVDGEVGEAAALELYFPVPAHRDAWDGGENLLVGTALRDGETPVAFDTRGRRYLLDPATPPATPVLALVPVETDFARAVEAVQACPDPENCAGGGGGGGGTAGGGSLYMTASHFGDTYESWIKGSPEFEVHVLGQRGQSDSLMSYQCAGEHAGGPYTYDQNGKDWIGSVLLFSQAQFDQYRTAHPGQSLRLLFLEDDDTACQIKIEQGRFAALIGAADQVYRGMTSGRDSVTSLARSFDRARSAYNLLSTLASWIRTNDDAIGTAVEDDVVGTFYSGFNWIVKGDNNVTNGWVRLEMR